MVVKFKRAHLGYKAGDEVDVNTVRAKAFIEEGIAEDPRKEKKERSAAGEAEDSAREKNHKAGPGQKK